MFVTSMDESWTLGLDTFRTSFENRFPQATLSSLSANEAYAAKSENVEHEVDELLFRKAGDSLAIEGSLQGCARVAAWFRELVPAQYALRFYDLDYYGDVEVRPGMTAEAIAAAYTEAASS